MKILCYGDSNTWGYNPHSKFGEHYQLRWTDILSMQSGWQILNEGVNGREVPDVPASLSSDTDYFLIMLGTNDLLQLDTPEAAALRMKVFLSGLPSQKALLIAPPPMCWGDWVQDQDLIDDSIRLAMLYETLATEIGIRFLNAGDWNIPLCFDGVHITEDGQSIFAEALYNALEEVIQ